MTEFCRCLHEYHGWILDGQPVEALEPGRIYALPPQAIKYLTTNFAEPFVEPLEPSLPVKRAAIPIKLAQVPVMDELELRAVEVGGDAAALLTVLRASLERERGRVPGLEEQLGAAREKRRGLLSRRVSGEGTRHDDKALKKVQGEISATELALEEARSAVAGLEQRIVEVTGDVNSRKLAALVQRFTDLTEEGERRTAAFLDSAVAVIDAADACYRVHDALRLLSGEIQGLAQRCGPIEIPRAVLAGIAFPRPDALDLNWLLGQGHRDRCERVREKVRAVAEG